MTKDGKDEEMIYGLTIDERDALRDGLNSLPDTMPPRAVWRDLGDQRVDVAAVGDHVRPNDDHEPTGRQEGVRRPGIWVAAWRPRSSSVRS